MQRYNANNIKKMTPKARTAARKDLRFSKLSGMTTKKIISTILLLSLPKGADAFSLSFSGLFQAASAAGAFLAPLIQQTAKPAAYAASVKVVGGEIKSLLNRTDVKVYSAIVAAITVLVLIQRMYANRTRVQLENRRMAHNAEQRRLNRESQKQMFNMMIQGQTGLVKQAVQQAVAIANPMMLQLEAGRDPVVPIPRIVAPPVASRRVKQN